MEWLTRAQRLDYGATNQLMGALCARYRFFSMLPIGQSTLSRPICALRFGKGEERVLMVAAVHAQEWLTSLLCLRLIEEMGEALKSGRCLAEWDLQRALRGRAVMWVPLVNPDGVEIAIHGSKTAGNYEHLVREAGGDVPGRWQANARGVDLNHNFNAGFTELQQAERKQGIVGPCARQWGGPFAESEAETRALVNLCERMDFHHIVALHSQGEEIYWHYGERTPTKAKLMADVMAAVSGYTVAEPSGLATHGGFKDWFIERYARAGFTIELGKGENPLPLSAFEAVYRKARELLVVSLLL